MNMTLTGTFSPAQNGPGNKRKEWIFHTPDTSRYGASPTNTIVYHTTHITILIFIH